MASPFWSLSGLQRLLPSTYAATFRPCRRLTVPGLVLRSAHDSCNRSGIQIRDRCRYDRRFPVQACETRQDTDFVSRNSCLLMTAGNCLGAGRFRMFLCLCWRRLPALKRRHQCLISTFHRRRAQRPCCRECTHASSWPWSSASPVTRSAAGKPAK